MSKEQIIEYVMSSPYNTNRAVLESLLEDIGGGTEDINILRFVELGTYILEKMFQRHVLCKLLGMTTQCLMV